VNLLFANDTRGAYPQSWYGATTPLLDPFPVLRGRHKADVCVIGGGFTGVSAALHLAEAGYDVALVEAQRIGFGASGRNGGQLGSGQRQDQITLEKMVGSDAARMMWDLGQDAKSLVRTLIARHQIDCDLADGIAWAGTSHAAARDLGDYADHMDRQYGYALNVLDKNAFHALCPSPVYYGGVLDSGAAHLNPLALTLGLARACVAAGVRIFERAHVHHVDEGKTVCIRTDAGQIEADQLILACNGYLGGLDRRVGGRVMPINNFIVATEPLGARAADVCRQLFSPVARWAFVVRWRRELWLPISQGYTRGRSQADVEGISAAFRRRAGICVGGNPGHHNEQTAASCAPVWPGADGLGVFGARRGQCGSGRKITG
jgi:gamma-glutamylputrescine oxidase